MILGGIIGLVIYLNRSEISIWYVVYRFNSVDIGDMEAVTKTDTLFVFEGTLFRNYMGSYTNNYEVEGYRRQELKVYSDPSQSKQDVTKFAVRALGAGKLSISDTIFMENQRKKRIILDLMLLGFFLGIVIEFVRSIKKKPST